MRVVIIGGGFCGASLAKELDDEEQISVTLIDKNPFFEYNPSAHKCLTNPWYQQNIRVAYDRFLSHTEIITESVKRVFPFQVETDSKKIDFDYAVICLGCSHPIFLSSTENVFTLTHSDEAIHLSKALKNAQKVLIVGGGYIGTEIAGELVTKRSDLDVTLVHSHDRILERNTHLTSKYATGYLERRGIDFRFNEKIVDHPNDNEYITKNGGRITADICIWCAGITVDTSYLEGFSPSTIDKRGRIRVNDSLQLMDYPHLFAGGDVTSINEEKTARKAELHARIIASNLRRIHQGKTLRTYKTGVSPMVISLGDNHGVGTYGRIAAPGLLAGIGKWIIEWWTLRQFH